VTETNLFIYSSFMKLKNNSEFRQCFSGMKAFEPGEVREVSKWTAHVLLRNPFIIEAPEKKKSAKKSTKKPTAE